MTQGKIRLPFMERRFRVWRKETSQMIISFWNVAVLLWRCAWAELSAYFCSPQPPWPQLHWRRCCLGRSCRLRSHPWPVDIIPRLLPVNLCPSSLRLGCSFDWLSRKCVVFVPFQLCLRKNEIPSRWATKPIRTHSMLIITGLRNLWSHELLKKTC